MFCIKCQNDVAYCTCPDINERLAAIGKHSAFAVAWCTDCDKHVDQCDCPDLGQVKDDVFKADGKDTILSLNSAVNSMPVYQPVPGDITLEMLQQTMARMDKEVGVNPASRKWFDFPRVEWKQERGATTFDGLQYWQNVGRRDMMIAAISDVGFFHKLINWFRRTSLKGDTRYAYQKRGWDKRTCPCCGTDGTVPASWNAGCWRVCVKCGLPENEWTEFRRPFSTRILRRIRTLIAA